MEANTKGISWKALGLATVLALGSVSIGDQAQAADRGSDAWKEARIWTTFTLNQHLNPFELDVDVSGSTAVLSGTVQSDVSRDLAVEVARSVDGIESVDSRIVVDPSLETERDTDHEGERSFGERVSDATTAAAIKSQLLWNAHTDGLQVDVDVKHGIAILEGTADSDATRELAARIAGNTDGVNEVVNRLELDRESESNGKDLSGVVSDSWVATKVKSVLIWNREVPAHSIDVEVDNGVVTLHGEVDNDAQAELAVELADDLRGVRDVHSELTVS